jgi:hypothetical protein
MQHFLRQGHAVYVVDNVERGRAGWAPFTQVWPEPPIIRNAEESWTLFRFGRAEDYAARRAFEGQRFPVAAFDEFIRHAVPRWLGNNDAALRGFCAVLDRVGPCLVMAHSHGGEVAYRALHARPDLHTGLPSVRCVGYRQIWDYLEGQASLEEAVERAIAATRQLAKRQLTWLRSQPERMVIDCLAPDVADQVVKHAAMYGR